MLGTNDCKTVFSASPDVIGKGIRRLLIQAKQYSADSRILLVSPIHLGEQVWKDEFDPEFSPESVEVSRKLTDVSLVWNSWRHHPWRTAARQIRNT